MKLDDGARVVLGEDTVTREVSGESVLLHLRTERYFGLDALSTDMLTTLLGASSVASALQELEARYDVVPDRLRQDVEAFVSALVEHELVSVT